MFVHRQKCQFLNIGCGLNFSCFKKLDSDAVFQNQTEYLNLYSVFLVCLIFIRREKSGFKTMHNTKIDIYKK